MRRREFLTTVAAASLLPQVSGRAATARQPHRRAAAPEQLKLGVASYSLRKFPFDKALEMAKACDVRYINFKDVHLPRTDPPEAIKAARAKTEAAGFTIMGGGTITWRQKGPAWQASDDEQVRKDFEYAQARRNAAHRRRAKLRGPRHGREGGQGVRHQGRHPQSRPGGQVLPVAVRRLQAHQGPRQAHGHVRRHRAHVARRCGSDQGRPRAPRPRLRSARQGLERSEEPRQPGDRRQGRDRFPGPLPRARQDRLHRPRRPRVRDRRRQSAAGHAAVVRLHARRAGRHPADSNRGGSRDTTETQTADSSQIETRLRGSRSGRGHRAVPSPAASRSSRQPARPSSRPRADDRAADGRGRLRADSSGRPRYPSPMRRRSSRPSAHPCASSRCSRAWPRRGALRSCPNGDMLITEKAGKLRIVRGGTLDPVPVAGTPEVFAVGQGGLLEVAVHPQFAQNQFVYLTYSKGKEKEGTTALARGRFDGKALVDVKDSARHRQLEHWRRPLRIEARVRQGRHALHERRRAQRPCPRAEPNLHGGKILRLKDDGTVPPDNPFVGKAEYKPEIFTYGHRNVQGARRPSRHRRDLGNRARAAGWRRAQPGRGRQELRLAGRHARPRRTAARSSARSRRRKASSSRSCSGRRHPDCPGWRSTAATSSPAWKGQFFLGALAGTGVWRVGMNEQGAGWTRTDARLAAPAHPRRAAGTRRVPVSRRRRQSWRHPARRARDDARRLRAVRVGVRPGSDRGQTGVRPGQPGSDRGQT